MQKQIETYVTSSESSVFFSRIVFSHTESRLHTAVLRTAAVCACRREATSVAYARTVYVEVESKDSGRPLLHWRPVSVVYAARRQSPWYEPASVHVQIFRFEPFVVPHEYIFLTVRWRTRLRDGFFSGLRAVSPGRNGNGNGNGTGKM